MDKCRYCKKELNSENFVSSWHSEEMHYKVIKCDCGKEDWIKVDFYGSGHDNFLSAPSSLESMVKKVKEK